MLKLSVPKMVRTITQLHFTGWPEHGLPQLPGGQTDMRTMLRFMHTVRKHINNNSEAPILVHCRHVREIHFSVFILFLSKSHVGPASFKYY